MFYNLGHLFPTVTLISVIGMISRYMIFSLPDPGMGMRLLIGVSRSDE